jgi:gamma-glutamylcyclotransferase (GGCT)/AIG2-like uncharacterized protein YtfP
MKKGDKCFVYGTLRRGQGAHSMFMEGGTEFIGTDRISGTMYALGGFPGVRLGDATSFDTEGPKVVGEVFEITDDETPKALDRYEGYPNLYDRKQVQTENGETVWVYEINRPQMADRIIPSGDWTKQYEPAPVLL